MVQCHSCKKKMGFLEKKIKRMTNEGEKVVLCNNCIKSWTEEEKKGLISKLYENSPPKLLFVIPEVIFTPPGDEDHTIEHLGHLLFMDKGICFLEVATKKSSDAEFGDNPGLYVFKKLFLWDINKPSQEKKVSGLETADDKSLKVALENANRMCFVHKEEIKKIEKPGSILKFTIIGTSDKKDLWWFISGISKETYSQYEDQIKKYLKN